MKSGRFVMVLCILAALGQCVYYWPRLPVMLASHFDASGAANGWQSKSGFFTFYAFILMLLSLVFVGMPLLIRHMPVSLINLPNKDYWLAPERREESLSFMQNQLELIGASTLLLIVAIMQFAFVANVGSTFSMPSTPIWVLLAVFVFFEMVCMVRMIARFSVKPK